MRFVATLVLFVALFVDPVAPRTPWPRCTTPDLAAVPFDTLVVAGDTLRLSAGLSRNDTPLVGSPFTCGGSRDGRIRLGALLWTGPGSPPGFARPDSCVVVCGAVAWCSVVAWGPEGPRAVRSGALIAPPVTVGDSVVVLVRFLDRQGASHWLANDSRVLSVQ